MAKYRAIEEAGKLADKQLGTLRKALATKVPDDLHFSVQPNTNEWWANFIEFWAARGADRRELNKAVVAFRTAQSDLTEAMKRK
jgi:hypothetical protein